MCLARRIIAANRRAPPPAARPSTAAPARSTNENGGDPCTGNSGVVPLIATSAEVAARRRDQRGQQHPPGEVLLERHLDREDRAGRRRLEDRRDTGGRAGDEQQVGVGADEQRAPAPLQRRADRRAHVDRRALEAHRAAAARASRPPRPCAPACRARRDSPARVKRVQVLVGRARRHAAAGIAQPQRGDRQTRRRARTP